MKAFTISAGSFFNRRRARAFTLLSASILTSLSGSTPHRTVPSIVSENEIDQALRSTATAALGPREGTIIVMDAQTGRVRAVVNPQLAFAQAMMPGSTVKPFTALAALRAGLIDADSRTVCPGRFTGRSFSLPCVHADHLPPFSPAEAIAYSCNYYFATLGQRLRRDQLIETLRGFGFGQTTGIDQTSEPSGTLRPCETGNGARILVAKSNHTLQQSDCDAREAIGESDHIQLSPIQLLTAYLALVNGGRLLQPRVTSASDFHPEVRARIDIAPQHRAIIVEGMSGAVRFGTAKGAGLASLPLNVIGKTGTSMPAKGFRTNGWFIGFVSSPSSSAESNHEPEPGDIELAVLILVSNSHGSEAATLARPIFETFANEISHRGTETQSTLDRNIGLDDQIVPASPRLPVSASTIRVHLVTENITQELSLEDYVLGVMRAEGSMETEPEALKALAIAIRTFALKNRGRHAKEGYDFCSTTHCQRFVGGNASPAMVEAVKATDGQTLTDDRGQPIDAYFGASCGGETANVGTLWGTSPPAYLRGVRDEYCFAGPHATWTDVINRTDLLRALQSDQRTNVGSRLDNVVVSKRDETGRAEFIRVEGELRKQVRGWDFKIIVGRVLGWNVLKSSRFEVARSGSNFIFHGSGFGHGLGLCQEGAHVMAQRGVSYQRILEKYFPGTTVKGQVWRADLLHSLPLPLGEGRGEGLATGPKTFAFLAKQRRTQERKEVPTSHRSLTSSLTLTLSQRERESHSSKYLSLSSEYFRVIFPASVDRRDANHVLSVLESTRADFLHRASTASVSVGELPTLEIRINESTGDFTSRTGQPWWAAAATKGNRIELQPLGILKRHGVLTTTLRHELAHAVIDAVSHDRAPRWLEEGFAIYLAGEGSMFARYPTKTRLPPEELEKRLERPGSQQEMRALYSLAYRQVVDLIRAGGEASVWKKLAAG